MLVNVKSVFWLDGARYTPGQHVVPDKFAATAVALEKAGLLDRVQETVKQASVKVDVPTQGKHKPKRPSTVVDESDNFEL